MDIQSKILGMSGSAREVLRCLFFHGPTWDGDIPSKVGRGELVGLGLAHHEFGWAWLTRDGIDFALTVMLLGEEKEKWQRQRTQNG